MISPIFIFSPDLNLRFDIFPGNSISTLDPNLIIPKYSPAITFSGTFLDETKLNEINDI